MDKTNCRQCPYGEDGYDPYSEICDYCMMDGDTGWGGFTDHRVGQHFYSIAEQKKYYDFIDDDEYDYEN